MTKEQAVAAYPAIHAEISDYLVDVRPKLKSFEAHLAHEKIRECVVEAHPQAADAEALREIALAKFATFGFKFLAGKGPVEIEPVTPVIFRRMNKGHGGEIIAVFPTDAASYRDYECGCYVHVGQHSACDPWHIMRHSKLATPAEYADLKAELEGAPYGYRFKVYTRLQRKWHEERAAELRRQGGVKIPKCGCDEREEIINRHSRAEA